MHEDQVLLKLSMDGAIRPKTQLLDSSYPEFDRSDLHCVQVEKFLYSQLSSE